MLQREGDALRARMWPDGQDEPDEWHAVGRDASFDEGRIGILHFVDGLSIDWAYIGVGTGGEPAPRPPDDLLD